MTFHYSKVRPNRIMKYSCLFHPYSTQPNVNISELGSCQKSKQYFQKFCSQLQREKPSVMRRNARAAGEPYCNRIVQRMVNLPRNLLGGVSRVMNQGIDLMYCNRGAGRRNQHLPQQQQQQQLPPPSFPLPHPPPPEPTIAQEEWAFLSSFEQQFGALHPFFYACRLVEVLKMAQDEHKFVFLYLHSPEHPFVPPFCRETLCSELVVQFLDANFVCWGELASRGEGLQMGSVLQPASFPFCAVVAPASDDNLAVLQQIEGPVSPAELVEILQRTMEEQGLAFGSSLANEEEKRRADRQLREQQDAAYLAALHTDQEKNRLKNLPSEERVQRQVVALSKVTNEKQKQNPITKQTSQGKEASKSSEIQPMDGASRGNAAQPSEPTQIMIRFPNGERREQSFQSTDKIQAIYRYIDSLSLAGGGVGSYRLVSSFPRKVYGVDEMGMTLKDAGLHPRASLFLELM